jgi:tetratricopeptide (TPR) repeat protein
MQGLRTLYDATGRRAAWRRLVNEVVPDFVDPASDGPLAGLEDEWSLVTEYRVRFAREGRNWVVAERLQRVRVDWQRQRAQPALAVTPDGRDATQRDAIHMLGTCLHELAQIQWEQGSPTCTATYREALNMASASGNTVGQAIYAFNLGHAYKDIADLRNLDEAERWYQKSLDLIPPDDRLGRGRCVAQLGMVAYERFKDARTAKRPVEELARHLTEAVRLYEQALDMFPATSVAERGVTHNALGVICRSAGLIDRALHHYQQTIRYQEQAGNIFRAGQTRLNVALALNAAGRLSEARAYAEAALANFRTFGDRAADMIQETERTIADIEQAVTREAAGA